MWMHVLKDGCFAVFFLWLCGLSCVDGKQEEGSMKNPLSEAHDIHAPPLVVFSDGLGLYLSLFYPFPLFSFIKDHLGLTQVRSGIKVFFLGPSVVRVRVSVLKLNHAFNTQRHALNAELKRTSHASN